MHQVTKPRGRHAVFVDPTGKRRRWARWAGITVSALLAAYLMIVAFGMVTGSSAPLTPWPDAKPSHRGAAPSTGTPQLTPKSSSASKRPTTSASPSGTAATSHSAASTTQPTTTSTYHPTPGRSHGVGATKSPRSTKRP